jgi:anti-sigma B factor antagonist
LSWKPEQENLNNFNDEEIMSFNSTERYNCVVIEFKGNVMGGPDAVSLNEKLHELIDTDKKNVVVDLGKVKFMNSSGLGMLIGALTTMRKAGGDLVIANATDKIESLLIVTKLITVFKHYKSLDEAVESFGE